MRARLRRPRLPPGRARSGRAVCRRRSLAARRRRCDRRPPRSAQQPASPRPLLRGRLRTPGRQPDVHGRLDRDDDELHRPARSATSARWRSSGTSSRATPWRTPSSAAPTRSAGRGRRPTTRATRAGRRSIAWEAYGSARGAPAGGPPDRARPASRSGCSSARHARGGDDRLHRVGATRPSPWFTLDSIALSDPFGSAIARIGAPYRRSTRTSRLTRRRSTTQLWYGRTSSSCRRAEKLGLRAP